MGLLRRKPKPSTTLDEARRAREQAEKRLEQTRAETPFYAALGASLKQLQERNHFAETFKGMQGGHR